MDKWFVSGANGVDIGPFTAEEVAARPGVSRRSLVKRQGFDHFGSAFEPVANFPELAQLVGAEVGDATPGASTAQAPGPVTADGGSQRGPAHALGGLAGLLVFGGISGLALDAVLYFSALNFRQALQQQANPLAAAFGDTQARQQLEVLHRLESAEPVAIAIALACMISLGLGLASGLLTLSTLRAGNPGVPFGPGRPAPAPPRGSASTAPVGLPPGLSQPGSGDVGGKGRALPAQPAATITPEQVNHFLKTCAKVFLLAHIVRIASLIPYFAFFAKNPDAGLAWALASKFSTAVRATVFAAGVLAVAMASKGLGVFERPDRRWWFCSAAGLYGFAFVFINNQVGATTVEFWLHGSLGLTIAYLALVAERSPTKAAIVVIATTVAGNIVFSSPPAIWVSGFGGAIAWLLDQAQAIAIAAATMPLLRSLVHQWTPSEAESRNSPAGAAVPPEAAG